MRSFGRNCGARGDEGMALVGVLILSALLMSLALTLAVAVRSDTQLRGAFGSGVTGFYAAEAGLNAGMGEYRNIFLNYNVPSGTDFNSRALTVGNRAVSYKMTARAGYPQNVVIPAGQVFTGLNAQQYRYVVNSTATNINNDVEAGVGAEFLVGYIPLFQFVAFYKNDLEILPGANMVLNGRVHTNGNLYLNSDASLTISDNPAAGVTTVQVSAGKNIYRGRKNDTSVCGGTVTVDKLEDKVAPAGDLDPQVLPCSGGTRNVPTAELATWKGSMIGNLGNIAIPEPDIIKPPVGVTSGGVADSGVYWDKADLHIILHVGQQGRLAAKVGATNVPFLPYRLEATTKDGTDVTASLYQFMMDAVWNLNNSTYPKTMPIFITDVPTQNGCSMTVMCNNNAAAASYSPAIATTFPIPRAGIGSAVGTYTESMFENGFNAFDLDYRRGGFFNRREGKWILMLNINVRDLILWNRMQALPPFFAANDNSEGGIVIYVTIDGPDSNSASNNYGVRVFGSADLPCPTAAKCGIGEIADPLGTTFVTDQALYVLGNYNRGTAGGSASERQPASLIGDSVNILSQNYWQSQAACNTASCRDGQSNQALTGGTRNAANTWINAAFLAGVDDTTSGTTTYNGGLENYPRFHEDWTGDALNYQGSFVSLGNTDHVNAIWYGTGTAYQIYNPPNRNWNFDPGFNDAANLPPLTPRFVYVQQVLFTEDFK